jgi:hypothetical protein
LVLLAFESLGQIIPADRLPTWQGNVGIPGGIPNRTTIFTNMASGATVAQIQHALSVCPSNQVVKLAAATYTFSSALSIPNGVTLRGAGMDNTIINSSANEAIQMIGSWGNDFGAPVTANHVSITSGYTQNSSSLTLSATSLSGAAEAVPAGRLVMIDQQSTTNDDATGGYGLQGVWWSIANPTTGSDRYYHEISYVTGKVGHVIGIDPPIWHSTFESGKLPQVWFANPGTPVEMAGVEDLTLHCSSAGSSLHGVYYEYTHNCWVKNCKVTNWRYGIQFYLSVRNEVRHCYTGGKSGTGDDYINFIYYGGGHLWEDNIVNDENQSAFLLESAVGCAFAYNYTTNGNSTGGGNMMTGDFNSHGGNNALNLLEGNSLIQVSLDNGWGSGFEWMFFRNRIRGWDEVASGYSSWVAAIDTYSMNRFMTYVGNVLGTSTKNTVYTGTSVANNLVYLNDLSISGHAPSPDPVVTSTMIRRMNWDSATSTNGGLVSAGFTSGDVASSLLYSSKPSYFGTLTWPPVDPTSVTYSSSITNIPAGYRLVNGSDPPAGGGDTTPPTLSSATIPSAGTSISLAISETWNFGAGGNGGVTMSMSGGVVTATYASGAGTSTGVWNLSRTVLQGETGTISYTQPGNGIEDTSGNDMVTFSGTSVVNNSTATGGAAASSVRWTTGISAFGSGTR